MHLFNCAFVNEFIVFKTLNTDKKGKFSKFLLTLAKFQLSDKKIYFNENVETNEPSNEHSGLIHK